MTLINIASAAELTAAAARTSPAKRSGLRPELAAFFIRDCPPCGPRRCSRAAGVLSEIASGRGYN